MKPATAQILRGVGLLIEIVGLMAFVVLRNDRRAIAGIELRYAAFACVVLGFTLWMVGVGSRQAWARRTRDPD